MLVGDWMTKEPVAITAQTSIASATKIMRDNGVRHLPVVKDGGTLIGIVTRTDILHAEPSPATSLSVWEISFLLAKLQVKDVMAKDVIVVGKDCPLEEAALVMAEHKIDCLPVVEGRRLVGIITDTDLLYLFTEQLGARSAGVRLTLLVDDTEGALSRLSGRITETGGNIVRLTSFPAPDVEHGIVTVKVEGVSKDELVAALSQIVDEVLDAREGQGWGAEGYSPYHWTLHG